jgi:hypothetical protein
MKRWPKVAAMVREELATHAPAPVDLNAAIRAARKPEPVTDRAQRLTGHFRGSARPMSDAPVVAPRVTAGVVPDPPDMAGRIRQLRTGA